MKIKLSVIALLISSCLVLCAEAKKATVDDIGDWTKEQVQAYLHKYQIKYEPDNESALLRIVKKHRDSALENTRDFIDNPSDVINMIIDSVKIKLSQSFKLSTENMNALTADLQHSLKQLELSGSLSHDKVKQSLDRLQHKVIRQKILSEPQFRELSQDIQYHFGPSEESWYKRFFGQSAPASSDIFPHDAYHNWLQTKIGGRLEENKELTKDEIATVINTLKNSIASSAFDLSQIGDTHWWSRLSDELTKNAKFKQNQVESVIESIQDEVTAYKIFAMDYVNEATENTQHMFSRAGSYIKDTGNTIYEAAVQKPSSSVSSVASAASSAAYAAASSASSGASYAAYAVSSSASSGASQAASAVGAAATSVTDAVGHSATYLNDKAHDAKDSLGNYWRQKELETYRKMGYTEAHIDWIQNYLSQTFRDKRNLTKEKIYSAVRTIRQYMHQAKIQSLIHIDSQLKSLEDHIENWRLRIIRDEL